MLHRERLDCSGGSFPDVGRDFAKRDKLGRVHQAGRWENGLRRRAGIPFQDQMAENINPAGTTGVRPETVFG